MINFQFSLSFGLLLVLVTLLNAKTKCYHCGLEISDDYVMFEGKSYHKACYEEHVQLRCDHCGETIEGQFNIADGKNYHPDCYRDNILQKCDICGDPLQGRYYTDYWGNSYHLSHPRDYPECSSCGRLICESLTSGGYKLSDGRHICTICNETAVTNEYQVESSMRYVRRLLASNHISELPEHIPVSLVDQGRLKRVSSLYSDAMKGFTDHNMNSRNGVVVSKESHIYILSDLPQTMFRAVLAHELLHVYLFDRSLDLRSDIREGFCNLGSELVYRESASRFAKYQLVNMVESPDPDYGAGYRKMSDLLARRGWKLLLSELVGIH
ncbi:MAG: protein DA1 [Candidatus Marinimicrobia bacterium]|nr:protein DA1 [Candidatus Neomarinimicrobiota bacterium]